MKPTYVDFVAPASEVPKGLYGHPDVCFQRQRVHRPRVNALDRRQLLLVRLHHVSQPEQTDKVYTTELVSPGAPPSCQPA